MKEAFAVIGLIIIAIGLILMIYSLSSPTPPESKKVWEHDNDCDRMNSLS